MASIPRVGFGGKDTADNVLGREGKIPTWQNPNLFLFQWQELSRIWGLREVPQAPWIFHGALILQKGTKPTGLCTNQSAGQGENQFVSRKIGFL